MKNVRTGGLNILTMIQINTVAKKTKTFQVTFLMMRALLWYCSIFSVIVVPQCFYDTTTGTYCNDHGQCNDVTEECECDIDYGLIDCSQQYVLYQIPQAMAYSLIILASIVSSICIAFMIWVYYNRKLSEVRAMSILFTQLTLMGCILICIGVVLLGLGLNDINCVILEWTQFIGICMVITCPLLKAYRIAAIFGKKDLSPEPVNDRVLIKKLSILIGVIAILLIAYTICNEIEGGSYQRYLEDPVDGILYKEQRCNGEPPTLITYSVLVSYPMFLIVALVHYAKKTRSAAKVFRETQCNYMGAYIGSTAFLAFGDLYYLPQIIHNKLVFVDLELYSSLSWFYGCYFILNLR